MEKNESVSNFLNEVGGESPDIFKEEPTEVVETGEEPGKEEKQLPFHQDPKVQRYVEKQIKKALEGVKPVEQAFRQELKDINLPDSFVQLVGNDTPEKQKVLKDLSDYMAEIPQKAREQMIREQAAEAQKQIEADNQAVEELESSFDEIEENYGVDLSSNTASAKQLRSGFIEYVRKIAPKDENGEVAAFPDLIGAFEDFQERSKKVPATRAKELATRGMTRSGDTSSPAPQGRTWKDVDRFLETLKKSN